MAKEEHESKIVNEIAEGEQEPDTSAETPKLDDTISSETLESIDQDAKGDENEEGQVRDKDVSSLEEPEGLQKPMKEGRLRRFLASKKGKWITAIGVVVVIICGLIVVPTTRYGILGYFIKKDVKITVIDSVTNKPVSQATVTLGPVTATTNGFGQAIMSHIPTGEYTFKVEKKYYKEGSVAYAVPIFGSAGDINQSLIATGRQVSIHVTNKITQAALAKATIAISGTSATTDSNGDASIVLPADQKTLSGAISLSGYNQSKVSVQVTDQTNSNTFTLVPSGSLYYLSKATGTINVMKSDLDGSNASVVVQGTGNESDYGTTLLATRDWKYLALFATRDPAQQSQLFLIDTTSGKLSLIDQASGSVYFNLVGWSNHHFVYEVTRNLDSWIPKNQTLKSFNADTSSLVALDETTASGTSNYNYQQESIQNPYIVGDKVTYTKTWSTVGSMGNQPKSAIMAVNNDGSGQQRLQEFTMQGSINMQSRLYNGPSDVYVRVAIDANQPKYYEYEDDAIKGVDLTDATFYSNYPTYLISPSGQHTLWSEPRDGKNTLFIGDQNATNPITLANESDYTAYGWYSDSYVLLSKNSSELYIAPATANFGSTTPLKVTNYHKPAQSLYGYGSGYGGL